MATVMHLAGEQRGLCYSVPVFSVSSPIKQCTEEYFFAHQFSFRNSVIRILQKTKASYFSKTCGKLIFGISTDHTTHNERSHVNSVFDPLDSAQVSVSVAH